MFIKSIGLSNYKGFSGENHLIEFNIPNGTHGSGLNIFVGNNNSGKSTVFESIDFLRNGFKEDDVHLIKNKLSDGTQSCDAVVELVFCGNIESNISAFVPANKHQAFIDLISADNLLKARRSSATCKKIYLWNETANAYTNPSGIDAPFKTLFETNFIWADTNPSSELAFGTTTLCGLLLKEIAQAHINSEEYLNFQKNFNSVFNDESSRLRQQVAELESKVQNIFEQQFGSAKIRFNFEELKIDSFFRNISVSIDDGVNVPMSEKGNGMKRAVALALLQVYAEQLAQKSHETQTKPFYLFIDEPEVCLHPLGQIKLFESLLEISKYKQVFVTTHSPYFLSSQYLSHIGLYIFKRNEASNTIENVTTNPTFPWSPTWGEINYKAYDLPTVEFHNELYGFLQEHNKKYRIAELEDWFVQNNLPQTKKWSEERDGNPKTPYDVTLPTFIRNHIHHPENKTMQSSLYTKQELRDSITMMLSLIHNQSTKV